VKPAPTIAPGTLVDHYKVRRLLGRGGMGEVYLARDMGLGRRAALKLLRPEALGDRQALDRFLFEARTTARFSHPHIITVFGVGEHEGNPYVALEYLEGQSLRDRMRSERIGERDALRIGLAIAEALAEAHSHGVLHRDLKPENVMIPSDGRLRVLDFGLAKALPRKDLGTAETAVVDASTAAGWTAQDVFQTLGGGLRGTPAYMAPEQWSEQPCSGETDVWALGLILHELLSGRLPYDIGAGPSPFSLGLQVCGAAPIPPLTGDVSGEVVRLVGACLAKRPEDRLDAAAVVAELQRLVAGGPALRADDVPPFRGLLPFGEGDADRFFGREAEVLAFLERLRHDSVLPVVGPSGAGKSSFVEAGVVPRLREQGGWLVLRLRPGRRPLEALAARLSAGETAGGSGAVGRGRADAGLVDRLRASPGRLSVELGLLAERAEASVLLFVDQLAELYTLSEDETDRRAFMEAVCSAADDPDAPVRVVFTLRDDYLGRLAEGEGAREALGRVTVLRRPGPEALAEIVVGLARSAGYGFDDPSLVEEMVASVHGEPAALPLLQVAGQILWEERDREARQLLRSTYDDLGGVPGALARHADAVLSGLSADQERVARELCLRLVTEERTRRVLARSELLEGLGESAGEVLDRFVRARLVTVRKARVGGDEADLELVHESLLRTWDRLARWLEEGREDLAFLREVEQSAALWDRRGRKSSEVWTGDALHDALRSLQRCTAALPRTAREFLEAGRRRERGRIWRQRGLLAGGFAVLASVAVVLALQAREADRQRGRAEAERRQAESSHAEALREGARAAHARGDLLEARARLRASLELRDSVLARGLWAALEREPLIWQRDLGGILFSVDLSPDGRQLAVGSYDRTVRLIDVATGTRRVLRGHGGPVASVAFSPDGLRVASAGWGGKLRLWSAADGTELAELEGHSGAAYGVAWGPRGVLLASVGTERAVRLWDTATRALLRTLEGHTDGVLAVAVDPTGRFVASGASDGTARVWRTDDGTQVALLAGEARHVGAVAFSPDGSLLATGATDGAVRLWFATTGTLVREIPAHTGGVRDVDFSRDGRQLASAGQDGTVRLWDASTGKPLRTYGWHTNEVRGVALGPKGRLLASCGYDQHVRLADLTIPEGEPDRGHQQITIGLTFEDEGRTLVSTGIDGSVRFWDVASGRQVRVLRWPGTLWGVDLHPAGRWLAVGHAEGELLLWDLQGAAREPRRVRAHDGGVRSVAFSPDGTLLATSGTDGRVRLWQVPSWRLHRDLAVHRDVAMGLAFRPDGELLASGGLDGVVHVSRTGSGKLVHKLGGGRGSRMRIYGVTFSPDGKRLAFGHFDGSVEVHDLAGGAPQRLEGHRGRIQWLSFHPDGRRLGTPSTDGTWRLWDLETGTHRVFEGHRSELNFLRFDPAGRLAATTSDDGTVRLWDVEAGGPSWHGTLQARGDEGRVEALTSVGPEPGSRQAAGWRGAATRAKLGRVSPSGRHACLWTAPGSLQTWDLRRNKKVADRKLPEPTQLLAEEPGCLVLSGGEARLVPLVGEPRSLITDASCLGRGEGALLVGTARRILAFDPAGTPVGAQDIPGRPTAVAGIGSWYVLGYEDGSVEAVSRRSGGREVVPFEATAASAAIRIVPGPPGTVVVGFAAGALGLWEVATGLRLDAAALHGPVLDLMVEGQRLHALTELGDTLVRDLSAFHQSRCDLLAEVRRGVAVVWENGAPVVRPPPVGGECP